MRTAAIWFLVAVAFALAACGSTLAGPDGVVSQPTQRRRHPQPPTSLTRLRMATRPLPARQALPTRHPRRRLPTPQTQWATPTCWYSA